MPKQAKNKTVTFNFLLEYMSSLMFTVRANFLRTNLRTIDLYKLGRYSRRLDISSLNTCVWHKMLVHYFYALHLMVVPHHLLFRLVYNPL